MSSKIGFLFPGQGSQHVGMAKDLVDAYPKAKTMFEHANDILGFDLATFCFEGPEEKIKQTYITQPAIFVHSCIVLDLIKALEIEPEMTAGHSLGEYSALVAAGALEFEAALQLVKIRAQAMQEAGQEMPGTMAAIIGLDAAKVESICNNASESGIVAPANFNADVQVVISGESKAVHKAMELAKSTGAKKVVELVVGGAFHSPLMQSASKKLQEALSNTTFNDAKVPVYQNISAQPETKAEKLRDALDLQLVNPVKWIESVRNMIADGAGRFYEVGPNRVLTGLVRRLDRKMTPTAVGYTADLDKLAQD